MFRRRATARSCSTFSCPSKRWAGFEDKIGPAIYAGPICWPSQAAAEEMEIGARVGFAGLQEIGVGG